MAAVFALVLLPALAAVGFMVKTLQGGMTVTNGLVGITFTLLTAFVFAGVLGIVKRVEDETA